MVVQTSRRSFMGGMVGTTMAAALSPVTAIAREVPQRGSGPPQIPAVPVRGDLAVYGPRARGAADLALELEVLAGPDELMEGVGYKLELPPPRHEKLADFRVLVIDTHPLCPTADSIKGSLNGLAIVSRSLAAGYCARTRSYPTWREQRALMANC
jgi:amidase